MGRRVLQPGNPKVYQKVGRVLKRSFDHFVLEPIYKIITHTLEETKDGLANTLAQLDIYLKPATYKLDVKPLLQTIFMLFLIAPVLQTQSWSLCPVR